jgi:hypothetical protein
MPEYLVTFKRVGRYSNAVPPLNTNAKTMDQLEDKILRVVDRHLVSREVSVETYGDGSGAIFAGGREAGNFTWKVVE